MIGWFRSRRQRRIGDLRQRVAVDAERVRLYLTAVIVDARRVGAPVPAEVTVAVVAVAGWADQLWSWTEESES